MRLFHEIIELTDGGAMAIAVARPKGATPIPAEHVDALRRAGDVATTPRETLYFTRIDDDHAYLWHMIPSPMRNLERMLQ